MSFHSLNLALASCLDRLGVELNMNIGEYLMSMQIISVFAFVPRWYQSTDVGVQRGVYKCHVSVLLLLPNV